MSPSPRTSDIATRDINEIIPYWRNPRTIPDDAVNALVQSIQTYGYLQPIVVDKTNTIIIGHSRYAALRRMGETEVPVKVVDLPAEKAKQLRVLDNKTAEFSSWSHDDLLAELEDLDHDLMRAFFPEVIPAVSEPDVPVETGADPNLLSSETDLAAEFVCPSCFHSWTMEVTAEAVKTGKLEVA